MAFIFNPYRYAGVYEYLPGGANDLLRFEDLGIAADPNTMTVSVKDSVRDNIRDNASLNSNMVNGSTSPKLTLQDTGRYAWSPYNHISYSDVNDFTVVNVTVADDVVTVSDTNAPGAYAAHNVEPEGGLYRARATFKYTNNQWAYLSFRVGANNNWMGIVIDVQNGIITDTQLGASTAPSVNAGSGIVDNGDGTFTAYFDALDIRGATLSQNCFVGPARQASGDDWGTSGRPTTGPAVGQSVNVTKVSITSNNQHEFVPTSGDPAAGVAREWDTAEQKWALLHEPSATNVVPKSTSFDTEWTFVSAAITVAQQANTAGEIAPWNYWKWSCATTASVRRTSFHSSANTGGRTATSTVIAKAAEHTYVAVRQADASNEYTTIIFNLVTGAVENTYLSNTTVDKIVSTSLGNGWWKFDITSTNNATNHLGVNLLLHNAPSGTISGSFGELTAIAGTAGQGVYVAYIGQEGGTVATSPIPTYGTAVVRDQDEITWNWAGLNVAPPHSMQVDYRLLDAAQGDLSSLYADANERTGFQVGANATTIEHITGGSQTLSGQSKTGQNTLVKSKNAVALNTNAFVAYGDGKIGSGFDATGAVTASALQNWSFGNRAAAANIFPGSAYLHASRAVPRLLNGYELSDWTYPDTYRNLLEGETDGVAVHGDGVVQLRDASTPANDLVFASAQNRILNGSTSPKLVLQDTGRYAWSPHNLVADSEDISQWGTVVATVVGNTVTCANGTSSGVRPTVGPWVANQVLTTRVVLEYVDKPYICVIVRDTSNTDHHGVVVDIQNGVITDNDVTGSNSGTVLSSSVSVEGSRVTVEFTGYNELGTDAGTRLCISFSGVASDPAIGTGGIVTGGAVNGDMFNVYEAQINKGPLLTEYIKTEGSNGVGVASEWNVYENAWAILHEPEATNLIPRSEGGWSGGWNDVNVTLTQGELMPTGDYATLQTTTAGGTDALSYESTTISAGVRMTFSAIAKPGNTPYIWLNVRGGSTSKVASGVFDLSDPNRTASSQTFTNGDVTLHSTKQERLANGWYRISLDFTSVEAGSIVQYGIANSATGNSFRSNGVVRPDNAGETINAGQFQIETGTVATSPIPTYGGIVVRDADDISWLGIAWAGARPQGSMLSDMKTSNPGNNVVMLYANSANGNESNEFRAKTPSDYDTLLRTNNVQINVGDRSTATPGVRGSLADAWAQNDYEVVYDGVQSGTNNVLDMSNFTQGLSRLYFGSRSGAFPLDKPTWYFKVILWNRRLPSEELLEVSKPTWNYGQPDLLEGETQGIAIDGENATVHVRNYNNPSANKFQQDLSALTNGSTSPKLCLQSPEIGGYRWSPHNYQKLSENFASDTSWELNAETTKTNKGAYWELGVGASSTNVHALVSKGRDAAPTGATNKYSVKARVAPGTHGYVWLRGGDLSGNNVTAVFNLYARTFVESTDVNNGVLIETSIEEIEPGIFDIRIDIECSANWSGGIAPTVGMAPLASGNTFTGSGAVDQTGTWAGTENIRLYHVALTNLGGAPYVAVPGLSAVIGAARDYDPDEGVYSILHEPSETNIYPDGMTFDNGSDIFNCTLIQDAIDGPLGVDAVQAVADGAGGIIVRKPNADPRPTNQAHNLQWLVKSDDIRYVFLRLNGNSGGRYAVVVYDLVAGTVTQETFVSEATGGYGTITPVGDGWFLLKMGLNTNTSSGNYLRAASIGYCDSPTPAVGSFGGVTTGPTPAGASFYIQGAKLSNGRIGGSPIPTYGASVTRDQDEVRLSLAGLPIAQDGTVLQKTKTLVPNNGNYWSLYSNTGNYLRSVPNRSQDKARFYVWTGSVAQADIEDDITVGQSFKAAQSFDTNDFALSIDGRPVVADTSGSLPSVATEWQIGHHDDGDVSPMRTYSLTYLPRVMTDQELIDWSTPDD